MNSIANVINEENLIAINFNSSPISTVLNEILMIINFHHFDQIIHLIQTIMQTYQNFLQQNLLLILILYHNWNQREISNLNQSMKMKIKKKRKKNHKKIKMKTKIQQENQVDKIT